MNDGWALLRAIEADPADDVPRLAYADWLEENGNQPRAEFIRLQVRRGEAGAPGEREKELLAAHEKAWLGELPGQTFRPRFRRGFLNPVNKLGGAFVRDGERMAGVAPLHHVELVKLPSCAAALAATPILRHVRRLNAVSNVVRNEAVAALAKSPHLVNLASLNLGQNLIGVAGCQALAEAELPALRGASAGPEPDPRCRAGGAGRRAVGGSAGDVEHLPLQGGASGPGPARRQPGGGDAAAAGSGEHRGSPGGGGGRPRRGAAAGAGVAGGLAAR